MKNLKLIAPIFFYLFFAFLPFQINALIFSEAVYGSGFFNPYLSHFIYLSDIFFVLGFLFWAPSIFHDLRVGCRKLWLPLLLMALSFVISLFFSVDVFNSLIYFLRFFQIVLVYLLLVSGIVDLNVLFLVFLSVMFFESLLGISQYVLQESLGLRFFGEPLISSAELGVAKVGLFDKNVLRIYGTFPHPNIFAAYLLFSIFLSLKFIKNSIFFKILLGVLILALFLTFSRIALLSLFVGMIIYLWKFKGKISYKWIAYLSFAFLTGLIVFDFYRVFVDRISFGDTAFFQRNMYLDIAKNIITVHPFGVGAGNFTSVMQDFTSIKLLPWLFQPVHNVYLLVFAELGFLGLFAYIFLFISYPFVLIKNIPSFRSFEDKNFLLSLFCIFISFAMIAFFDHYFISLYQGQMIFAFLLGISGYYLKKV